MKDILFLLALTVAVVSGFTDTKPQTGIFKKGTEIKQAPTTERLRWYAAQAKSEGRREIKIPSLKIEYSGDSTAITLDEALKVSTVVVAQLVEKKSYEQSGNNIVTWNKFRITDVLSEAQETPCPLCLSDKPPQEMLPLQSREFLLSKSGGRINIDGVAVEQVESAFPEFQENRTYVLFLTLHPTGVAETIGGPVGVFRLDDRGNALPVSDSSHLLKKEFKDKFGNSPERLRGRTRE